MLYLSTGYLCPGGCDLVSNNVIGNGLVIGKQFEFEIEFKLNNVKNEWCNVWAFQVMTVSRKLIKYKLPFQG